MSAAAPAPDALAQSGPLDDAEWPAKLKARVVLPGARPAIHGYDVEGDLARHHSFTESVLLALTGELPAREQARAFEIALQFLSPSPVHEAPTHAAVLARICDVTTSAIIGTAAIALAEQARSLVEAHAPYLRWLGSNRAAPPPQVPPVDGAERASVDRLRDALREAGLEVDALAGDVGRVPALLATMVVAGLTRPDQIESAIVLARLPSTLAEAMATPTHSYRDYPVLVPPVSYAGP